MLSKLRYWSRNLVREFGFFKKRYGDTDAAYSETHALIELSRIGALEVGELAKLLNVDKSGASRILGSMLKKSWVQINKTEDQRKKKYKLSNKGNKVLARVDQYANEKVQNALLELTEAERETVFNGIELYAKALQVSRLKNDYLVRPIKVSDNKDIAKIVKKSLRDFGFNGPGTVAADESLDYLSSLFVDKSTLYLVAEKEGIICGGAGIIPLIGGSSKTCELVRMFIDNQSRGRGLGQLLITEVLKHAKNFGYNYCYLETTEKMKAAQNLYINNGFEYLKKRQGNTGHFACKVYMGKKL